MHTMLQFFMQRGIRDERGAEMVEWVLWVGGLAVVVTAVATALGPVIIAAVTAMIGALPGA